MAVKREHFRLYYSLNFETWQVCTFLLFAPDFFENYENKLCFWNKRTSRLNPLDRQERLSARGR